LFNAHHFPDKDAFIVPDVYAKQYVGTYPDPGKEYKMAQDFYLKLLNNANSNWSGCWQYVEDSYEKYAKECFPNAFMIDSNTVENHEQSLILMVVHKSNCNHVDDQCTICIQRVVNSPEWDRCHELCVALGSWLGGVDPHWMLPVPCPMSEEECRRVPYGFDGVMFALGKHVNQHQAINNNYVKYRTHHFEHIRVMSECLAC